MNTTIIEPTSNFDFTNKIYLGTPSVVSSGVYFTPIFLSDKSVIIQSPMCTTKQGFKNTSGKKMYTDLVFNSNDVFFINWMENLEATTIAIISNMDWFEKKIEQDELETMFVSCFKLYKSGKKYLFRTNVKPNILIYDNSVENTEEKGKIIKMEDIVPDKTTMICILEIRGVKFTSQSFQFDIEIKQIAVVNPDPYLDTCFVKIPMKPSPPIHKLFTQNPTKNNSTFIPLNDISDQLELKGEESKEDELKEEKSKEEESKEEKSKEESKELKKIRDKDKSCSLSRNDIEDIKNSLNVSFNPEVNVQTIPVNKTKKSAKNIKIINDGEEINNDNEEEIIDLLDVEDISTNDEMNEIMFRDELDKNGDTEPIILKKPKDIYYEMFQSALLKADVAKKEADRLYLKAEEIKQKYGIMND